MSADARSTPGGGLLPPSDLDAFGLPPRAPGAPPEVWLILNAIQKSANVGALVRTAVAFGATGVAVCGGLTARVSTLGAKGAERGALVAAFPGRGGLRAAAAALRARGVRVVGLEICAGAMPVGARGALLAPGGGGVAVMPGNESAGLTPAHKAACDAFAYVPQYGAGTASLNVAAATAIALHHAAAAAGLAEAPRDAGGADKFAVARPPAGGGAEARGARALAAARAAAAADDAAAAAGAPPAAWGDSGDEGGGEGASGGEGSGGEAS